MERNLLDHIPPQLSIFDSVATGRPPRSEALDISCWESHQMQLARYCNTCSVVLSIADWWHSPMLCQEWGPHSKRWKEDQDRERLRLDRLSIRASHRSLATTHNHHFRGEFRETAHPLQSDIRNESGKVDPILQAQPPTAIYRVWTQLFLSCLGPRHGNEHQLIGDGST